MSGMTDPSDQPPLGRCTKQGKNNINFNGTVVKQLLYINPLQLNLVSYMQSGHHTFLRLRKSGKVVAVKVMYPEAEVKISVLLHKYDLRKSLSDCGDYHMVETLSIRHPKYKTIHLIVCARAAGVVWY